MIDIRNMPPPFPQGEPRFVEALRRKPEFRPYWNLNLEPQKDEADFRKGLDFRAEFPDPEKLLVTATEEMVRFLREAGIFVPGAAPVITRKAGNLEGESFRVIVEPDKITIEAGDTEGIRRGVYYLEDLLAGSRAPFLKLGETRRDPWLKNRISRCFFGPIKRPPFNRDELMDEIDYYPEEYLNRLAREGVNGLWLTIVFREICTTSFYPRDPDAEKRLEKLRRSVMKCRRYGIKIWVFCIEPFNWGAANPCPEGHPELKGPLAYTGMPSFCPNSEAAGRYLYECTNSLFAAVPDLGGLITISHGERPTSCLSTLSVYGHRKNPCEGRCDLSIGEILSKVLLPMADGMHAANPKAELISWLYMPYRDQLSGWIYEMPERLTKDVILAFNFESGCNKEQLGKVRNGGDYWLSCVGPSDRFGRMAAAARGRCEMAAKLQVCCSHEVATIPFLPVPGLIYRKYREMKKLGVRHVIQCWYFGNYPGLMNKAAGHLAFEDFTRPEKEFLEELAFSEWGAHAKDMAEIWDDFAEAYSNYPLDIQFQYYGPMHDGPVWPLHLKQVMKQLPRTWKPDYAPAGDAVGESMFNHELPETMLLTRKIADGWHKGMEKLNAFVREYLDRSERMLDASLYEALDIQFRSGANILEFYSLRNRLMDSPPDAEKLLDRLEAIVKEEIGNSLRLAELCEADSRLGYHSEAEVYKYFPEKLRWRVAVLQEILAEDFAECRIKLKEGVPAGDFLRKQEEVHTAGSVYRSGNISWSMTADIENVIFDVECRRNDNVGENDMIALFLMDCKGERAPWRIFIGSDGSVSDSCDAAHIELKEENGGRKITAAFPRAMTGDREFYFGIEHYWNDAQGVHSEHYPAGNYPNEQRLNLGYFTPDRMVLVRL